LVEILLKIHKKKYFQFCLKKNQYLPIPSLEFAAPRDYTNFQAEICTLLFNKNKEKRYKIKQHAQIKEPYYN
jgi:hypothetical protein